MAHYWFFSVGPLGHIFSAREFEGEDDIDAVKAAQKLCATHGIEVWQGDRLIAQLKRGGEMEEHAQPLLIPNVLKLQTTRH